MNENKVTAIGYICFTIFMLGFFVFGAAVFLSNPSPTKATDEFVSPWTEIKPGSTVAVDNPLGVRPNTVDVWVAVMVKNQAPNQNFNLVTPIYETDLVLREVSANRFLVDNFTGSRYWFQIVSRP